MTGGAGGPRTLGGLHLLGRTTTAAFVICTGDGFAGRKSFWGRSIRHARIYLSPTPATRFPFHSATGGDPAAAAIFVAVLGASSYTYSEATATQGLAD